MNSSATANPVLSQTLARFMASSIGFAASVLAPAFITAEAAAEYYVYDRENFLSIPTNLRRGPSQPYSRSIPKLSDDKYSCKDYGHEELVDDKVRARYAKAFDADRAAARRLAHILLVNREIRVRDASAAFPNANIAVKWDQANANPKADVQAGRRAIHGGTGVEANVAVIPRRVFEALTQRAEIIDAFKHVKSGVIKPEMLAEYFEIERVVVAGSLRNTAAEGQAVTAGLIWGVDVVLAYVDPAASTDLMVPTAMRTFAWSEFSGDGDALARVTTWRQDEVDSDVHRGEYSLDEKITAPEAGFRLVAAL